MQNNITTVVTKLLLEEFEEYGIKHTFHKITTTSKVDTAIRRLKNNKIPGLTNILAEVLKVASETFNGRRDD